MHPTYKVGQSDMLLAGGAPFISTDFNWMALFSPPESLRAPCVLSALIFLWTKHHLLTPKYVDRVT